MDKKLNPFPGLRPFEMQEKYLFFGREDQTVELLKRLNQARFMAVVGTSGSGKSSLVRAGLLPELHGGTMTDAGSSWEIAVMRPGGDLTVTPVKLIRDGQNRITHVQSKNSTATFEYQSGNLVTEFRLESNPK